MTHRTVSFVIALLGIGCGSSSGMSAKSQPRTACFECQNVATYAAIDVASGWTGECWESETTGGAECKQGPLPTPGTECKEYKHACKKVEHDIAVRCADNRCRVGTPTAWPPNGYEFTLEQTRDVVITRGGAFTMDVEFKPKKGGEPRVEHVPVTATTPDDVRASCRDDVTGDVEVELLAGDAALGGRYTELAITMAGAGPCPRLTTDPAGRVKNLFRCPTTVKGASIEVRQPDFSKTLVVTCR